MLEEEMVTNGIGFLKTLHFQWIRAEVPFLSRCIDVLALDEDNQLISIEFKVTKWRHAIKQASEHSLASDKAYICLPRKKPTPALLKALREVGVGLMLYDVDSHEIKTILESEKRNVALFREQLIITALQIPEWSPTPAQVQRPGNKPRVMPKCSGLETSRG